MKTRLLKPIYFLLAALSCLPGAVQAQLVIGQYEDEAPLASWNSFGFVSAASLGRGACRIAMATDATAALANPALLAELPSFTLDAHNSVGEVDLFRYGPVNTGLFMRTANSKSSIDNWDGAGASLRWRGWSAGLCIARLEDWGRPGIMYEYRWQGQLYQKIEFKQAGGMHVVNLALARKLGRRVTLGLGINYCFGTLERSLNEAYPLDNETLTDEVSQSIRGWYVNSGLVYRFSKRLAAGLALRLPYDRRVDSQSTLAYHSPAADKSIAAAEEDRFHQPLAAGVGLHWQAAQKLQVVADLLYFDWQAYKVTAFGEEKNRDFRSILVFAAGAEYHIGLRLFRSSAAIPVRIGLQYDPQPMRDPASAYWNITIGYGLQIGSFRLEAGWLFGRESGSGNDLKIMRMAISLGISKGRAS